ncbi:MAG: 3'-5' exonuclease [Sphaerochaetaceae bacterium]|jgi:DNA polymerase-3 subunit epsilon
MRYVAIDFETANAKRVSACSVGLAKMESGKVIDTFYTLLSPPTSYFDPINIEIHGITFQDVADAPPFDEVWEDLRQFIGDDLLIAHNAPFDISVLKQNLQWYNLTSTPIPYMCTLQLSKRAWPRLASHRLSYLSMLFGREYQSHHALEDAIQCGIIFHQVTQGADVDQLQQSGITLRWVP